MSLLALTTLFLTLTLTTICAASPAKPVGRSTAITPPVTTAGQAATAELLMDQTPREVVYATSGEVDSACLAITDATSQMGKTQIGTVYDGWPDLLGPTAEESVNKYLMDEMKPSGTHDGRLDDAGKADCHLRTIVAPAATPTLSDATPRNINLTYGVNGPNNTTKVADTGDRPRR